MRNAIHQGNATLLLESLKDNPNFKNATNNGVKSKFMKDRYLILRFIAFYLWKNNKLLDKNGEKIEYKSGIDDFLGATMELLNRMELKELEQIEDIFDKAMKRTYNILGPDAFRSSTYMEDELKKKPISMALFDSIGYLMTFAEVAKNKKLVLEELTKLFKNGKFLQAIITPVNSTVKVHLRFRMIDSILSIL
jgi:hypothetical protein